MCIYLHFFGLDGKFNDFRDGISWLDSVSYLNTDNLSTSLNTAR